jgi:hypothetical protein
MTPAVAPAAREHYARVRAYRSAAVVCCYGEQSNVLCRRQHGNVHPRCRRDSRPGAKGADGAHPPAGCGTHHIQRASNGTVSPCSGARPPPTARDGSRRRICAPERSPTSTGIARAADVNGRQGIRPAPLASDGSASSRWNEPNGRSHPATVNLPVAEPTS